MNCRNFCTQLAAWVVMGIGLNTVGYAQETPFLHPLFTEHMVLQREVAAPVWGWTTPGAEVTVSLAGKSASTTAGQDGRWMVKIGPLPAGGPHTLQVRGPQEVTVKNVLIGDVWICSGQSNMEWPVAAANNPQEEIAQANDPQIRLFTVPKRIANEPEVLVESEWQICSSQTIGGFTAVGYFFGRELHKELQVPIGLIHTSWGGTVAEAWTSAEALETMEDFRPTIEAFRETVALQNNGKNEFDEMMANWWQKNDPGSQEQPDWAAPELSDAEWSEMELPTAWESAGLPDYDGVAWFRKSFTLPKEWAGAAATLELGPIDDRDTTWVNGVRVGSTDEWNRARSYSLEAGTLREGENVIAIRVLDTGGNGGICGQSEQMSLRLSGANAPLIPLAGTWSYKDSVALNKTTPLPQQVGSNPNVVTVLYNGMVAPLIPFGIKGAIWYQGESNAGRAYQYRTLLPTMIKDWRSRFGVGDFPFFIVQLANFMDVQQQPVQPGWAELREAQLLTAQNDPNVGLAVAIDIGEANDIHPRNKQDVGRRLALSALGIAYQKELVDSGPDLVKAEFRDGKAYLKFDHVGEGLVAAGGGPLKGFAIAGEDKQFVWGEATIDGDTVIVSSPTVSAPTAVRYGWANNPTCNLANQAGLPASPFRTDVDP